VCMKTSLTPKGFDYVFTKNTPKLSLLVQVPNCRENTVLDTCNRRILSYVGSRRCQKNFKIFYCVDCKILVFELKEILFLAL